MNISEACDAQAVVEFLTRITLLEVAEPGETSATDSALHGAIERLAARSRARLGAGIDGPEAVAAARRAGIIPTGGR